MLFSKKFCVIVFMFLSLPVDALYASHATPYRGTILHNSHPMLASVFNLASNVQQLQTIQDMGTLSTLSTSNGDSPTIMRTGQIVDAHNGIQLSFNPAQLRRHIDITNVASKEASSDIITETTNLAQRHGNEITGSQKPIVTVKTGMYLFCILLLFFVSLLSLHVYISLSLYLSFSISLFLYLSLSLYISLSLYLYLSPLSISLSLSLSFSLPLSFSISLSLSFCGTYIYACINVYVTILISRYPDCSLHIHMNTKPPTRGPAVAE